MLLLLDAEMVDVLDALAMVTAREKLASPIVLKALEPVLLAETLEIVAQVNIALLAHVFLAQPSCSS